MVTVFRGYGKPSSSSPFWSGQHHMKRFGGTVNQVVAHLTSAPELEKVCFGSTANQAVVHPPFVCAVCNIVSEVR
ncbi:hypothetical protein DW252_12170 [Coprococcus comes]|uniref:Uncharacterized protein n=1 Tax=Coprococcus comes TaxID=410072 RepID=A0A3R6HSS7_9FIRM|nr:hypothetical protein DW252_12170 [Coprococcus comes]